MNKEKLKDLIFTAQCAIGEYNDTLDDDLLDKADDLLEEALDSRLYKEIHPSRIHISRSELIKALEEEGHKMISKSLSDFYSDGLRFSTSTYFG